MFNYLEKDMEDFIEKNEKSIGNLIEKNYLKYTDDENLKPVAYLVDRQTRLCNGVSDIIYRVDEVFKSGDETDEVIDFHYVICELKKTKANIEAFNQVVGYCKELNALTKCRVKACIIAPEFSDELTSLELFLNHNLFTGSLGLIKANVDFRFELGDYCHNKGYYEPFEDLDIVKKIKELD